jgi:hypothetical protein
MTFSFGLTSDEKLDRRTLVDVFYGVQDRIKVNIHIIDVKTFSSGNYNK